MELCINKIPMLQWASVNFQGMVIVFSHVIDGKGTPVADV